MDTTTELKALEVEYCGQCGLPYEYCEYGPNYSKCVMWLRRNRMNINDMVALNRLNDLQLNDEDDNNDDDDGILSTRATTTCISNFDEKVSSANATRVSNGHQSRGGKANKIVTKTEEPKEILISVTMNRGKRLTTISNLSTHNVKLSAAKKAFSQKFSCGCAVGSDKELTLQGDYSKTLIPIISENHLSLQMNLKACLAILFVYIGCCTNVYFLETLVKMQQGVGNIVTLAQFVFVSSIGLSKRLIFRENNQKSIFFSHIPIMEYVKIVLLFTIVSILNNYALSFDIAMPLHMIFRSGSLICTMILGVVMQNRRYKLEEYLAVLLIAVGITSATIASANLKSSELKMVTQNLTNTTDEIVENASIVAYLWWCFGLLILIIAMVLSARLGIQQERVYSKYGKYTEEALFFCHLLPLPTFILLLPDLIPQIRIMANIVSTVSPWMLLLGNIVTQYICISSVFTLTIECHALTVTLIITLRKFVSLIFSIWYFQNPFTIVHWLSTAAVFTGTLLYTSSKIFGQKKVEEKKE
ncbi:hypothetical protein SNEBB_004833 [Seison nebaliae]|nr:hypothetical protein SNEBB_004833 [Seison nebaliae]